MKIKKIVGLSGIVGQIKGVLKRGKTRIEEIRGQSVINKTWCETCKNSCHLPPHVTAVSGNGTAKGGLGEVAYSVEKIKGQALSFDWVKNGQNLAINSEGFGQSLGFKLDVFQCVFERFVKGYFILASRGEFLEKLVHFGVHLLAVRARPKSLRQTAEADL